MRVYFLLTINVHAFTRKGHHGQEQTAALSPLPNHTPIIDVWRLGFPDLIPKYVIDDQYRVSDSFDFPAC